MTMRIFFLISVLLITTIKTSHAKEFFDSTELASTEIVWLYDGLIIALALVICMMFTTIYIYRLNCRFVKKLNESKQLQTECYLKKEQLRVITDNINVILFLKDLDGRYLYVNHEYEKYFNITNAKIQGKTDYDIFPHDIADKLSRNDQDVIKFKQLIGVEEQVLHANDGLLHDYSVIKIPIFNNCGEIYAICGVATDITERKKNEVALYNAKEHAERILVEQRQIIAMISHDYRAPLAVIDSAAQLLATKIPEESDLNVVLARIRRGVSFLSNTIDNNIVEDRLDCEKLTLHCSPINLNDLGASVTEYANQISSHHIIFKFSPNLPLLNADEKLLNILLLNLLLNSIKYSPVKSKIELHIKQKGENCNFEVIDFGIGIPADELQIIFKKYVRGRLTTALSGAGLGLSLVLRIAKLHGGDAKMKSIVGHGSHITVKIPFETPCIPADSPV